MGRRQLSDSERAEAVLHSVVHGDDSAAERYGITVRTLRRYREEVRDPDSKLSAVVRRFSAAIKEAQGEDDAAADERAESFASYCERQVRRASDIIVRKAEEINAANPESLRAVNDHVATLLGHLSALQYIASLFGSGDRDAEAEGAR